MPATLPVHRMVSRKRFLLLLPPLLFAGLWGATLWLGKPQVERHIFEREISVGTVGGRPFRREDYQRMMDPEKEPPRYPFCHAEASSPFPLVVCWDCTVRWGDDDLSRAYGMELWFFGRMVALGDLLRVSTSGITQPVFRKP